MAIKTVKVTKYITSDGTEFIGASKKKNAEQHEILIAKKRKRTGFNIALAKILKDAFTDSENVILEKSLEAILKNDIYQNFIAEEMGSAIDRLFFKSTCPENLDDLVEAVTMIENIIDDFGGLSMIETLYKYSKKHKLNNIC